MRVYDRWGLRPFANIAGSEQVHMDAVLAILNHYGLPDPVEGLDIGAFHDPRMQSLYDDLVRQGLRSHEKAVQAGLHIEELDIADLRQGSGGTAKPELLAGYAALERGSRNHLRAFHRWMRRLGAIYDPAHLSKAEFESIALSAHETRDGDGFDWRGSL